MSHQVDLEGSVAAAFAIVTGFLTTWIAEECMNRRFERVAVVGAGLVGAGWAIVFARAGQSVSIYDAQPAIRASVMDWIRDSLNEMERCGLTRDVPSILARITVRSEEQPSEIQLLIAHTVHRL